MGFSVIQASDLNEQEKAYVLQLATTIVVPLGAGMTNLVFAQQAKARVVLLCPPTYKISENSGVVLCDWPRDWWVGKFLAHLHLNATVLNHGQRLKSKGVGRNQPWSLKSVDGTVATIRRCMNGAVLDRDCV